MSNPLLTASGLPLFDQVKAEHVAPAVEQILSQSAELLAEAEQAPLGDWDALMEPMRKIDLLFEYGWAPVNHLWGLPIVTNCERHMRNPCQTSCSSA